MLCFLAFRETNVVFISLEALQASIRHGCLHAYFTSTCCHTLCAQTKWCCGQDSHEIWFFMFQSAITWSATCTSSTSTALASWTARSPAIERRMAGLYFSLGADMSSARSHGSMPNNHDYSDAEKLRANPTSAVQGENWVDLGAWQMASVALSYS